MTQEELFTINTKVIWSLWRFGWKLMNHSPSVRSFEESECLLAIYSFLSYKNQLKGISEFRKFLGYTDSIGYALENEIRDMAAKGIYFGNSLHYEVNKEGIHEPFGLLVDQDMKPDFHNPNERGYFEDLFTFQFIKMEGEIMRNQFLDFHLQRTFNNDRKKLVKFLNNIKADFSTIIRNHLDALNDWIEDKLNYEKEQFGSEKQLTRSKESSYFKDAFVDNEAYNYIISELSKVEHGSWFDIDGNFIRKGRGNGQDNPSATGTLLGLLIERGYLKEDFKPWNNEKKILFIKNSFNVEIGVRTSNLKTNNKQLDRLNFILFRKKS